MGKFGVFRNVASGRWVEMMVFGAFVRKGREMKKFKKQIWAKESAPLILIKIANFLF